MLHSRQLTAGSSNLGGSFVRRGARGIKSTMESKISKATTEFGLKLIKNVLTDSKENAIISPLSLQSALSMILLGTGDDSLSNEELTSVLGYDRLYDSKKTSNVSSSEEEASDRLLAHKALKSAIQAIKDSLIVPPTVNETDSKDVLNFSLVNSVLSNNDQVRLDSSYRKELESFYDCQVEEFNWSKNISAFLTHSSANNSEELLHDHINGWVSNKTAGLIKDLVHEGDLKDQNLISVILNAAYFKGTWFKPFEKTRTGEMPFYNNGLDKGENTKFMMQTNNFKYADFCKSSLLKEFSKYRDPETTNQTEEAVVAEMSEAEKKQLQLAGKLDCFVLELAFSVKNGEEFSMVVLLPAQRDGLAKLLSEIDVETLSDVYETLEDHKVEVKLPKFTFEATYDTGSVLQKIGLNSIFGTSADLSRMFQSKEAGNKASVGKVVHKAKVTVDEAGAEAAAASMGTVMLRNFVRSPPKFIADHPFLFLIKHSKSHLPLFMGCVNKF